MNLKSGLSRIWPAPSRLSRRNRPRLAFEALEERRVLSAVSIPVDLVGEFSGQVVAPVNIDDATDVRAVEIEISYDTELLDTDSDSITAGAAWPTGSAEVIANVDDDAGTITVWVFAAEGLDSGSGSLLDIEFTVSSDALVGDSTEIDLEEVVINDGEVTVDPEPQSGVDSSDGQITFIATQSDPDTSGTASLSGYVYIDRDGDGIRDDGECGVPGVEIVLTGSDLSGNAVELNALTQGDGSYSFDGLAAGTYKLTERQPTAMDDGQDSTTASEATLADDDISNIILESGDVSTENNFGEAGLFTEYISINMFFASSPPVEECILETVAQAEELAGHANLADCIRNGDITFQNTAPSASGDTYSVAEGNVLTVDAASGVLANDEDVDGDLLTAKIVDLPSYGTIDFSSDGAFSYTPNDDFTDTDSFTYLADDGADTSEEATVLLTIRSASDDSSEDGEAYSLAVDAAMAMLASDADDESV